jgi:uncharacterized Zn-binding protein involved in type VI secretion
MPAVVRVGDPLSTGHGCDGSTTLASHGQDGTVTANSIVIAVVGAPTVVHNIPAGVCVPHTANLNAGSGSVFINGIPVGRVGDSADAGAMSGGSPNVFAGG